MIYLIKVKYKFMFVTISFLNLEAIYEIFLGCKKNFEISMNVV